MENEKEENQPRAGRERRRMYQGPDGSIDGRRKGRYLRRELSSPFRTMRADGTRESSEFKGAGAQTRDLGPSSPARRAHRGHGCERFGKSTLVEDICYRALPGRLYAASSEPGRPRSARRRGRP